MVKTCSKFCAISILLCLLFALVGCAGQEFKKLNDTWSYLVSGNTTVIKKTGEKQSLVKFGIKPAIDVNVDYDNSVTVSSDNYKFTVYEAKDGIVDGHSVDELMTNFEEAGYQIRQRNGTTIMTYQTFQIMTQVSIYNPQQELWINCTGAYKSAEDVLRLVEY